MKNTLRMFRVANHRTGLPLKYEVVVRDALAMRGNARPRRQRSAAPAAWAFWKRR
jgi:hypothetical protein